MTSLKQRSFNAIIWDFGGSILRQGVSFVISIFLARLLSPSEFGLVGMAMVFVSISQAFIDIGLTAGLIQKKENTRIVYSTVFYLNILLGILLNLTVFFSSKLISDIYDEPKLISIVQWLSFIFTFNAFSLVNRAKLRKELRFRNIMIAEVLSSFFGGVLGIIMAFNGFGVFSIVAQYLVSSLILAVLLNYFSKIEILLSFSFSEIRSLFGFSSYVFFDQLLTNIFLRLDTFVIGKLFNAQTLGFYTRAFTLKDLVTNYSSSSILKVFFPVLSSVQDDVEKFKGIYFRVVQIVAFIGYLLTGFLFFMGRDLILFLFGEKWLSSVSIFQILILTAANFPINAMIINAFISQGKSKLNFQYGLLRKSLRLIPIGIAIFYGFNNFLYAFVVVDFILTAVNIIFVSNSIGLPTKEHVMIMMYGFLPTSCSILLYFVTPLDIYSSLLSLAFIILYLSFNFIFNRKVINELITLIKLLIARKTNSDVNNSF